MKIRIMDLDGNILFQGDKEYVWDYIEDWVGEPIIMEEVED